MRFILFRALLCMIAVFMALAIGSTAALAHERRDVGNYQFAVGWIVEPSFEGIKNGLDLRVVVKEGAKPVEGLEKTLKWEVTHVATGVSKTLDIRTIFRDPGHYTADIIPTVPGVYRFRIFGAVEGAEVNQTFMTKGGGGGFGDIEPSDALQFPEKLPSLHDLSHSAASASTFGILGVALGALGIVLGGVSLVVARRKR